MKECMKRLLVWAIAVCFVVATVFTGLPERAVLQQPVQAQAASCPALKTIKYKATGDQRKDVVGFAKSQIGYAEGDNNNTYFGKWFGLNHNPWCAMFVSWCGAKAGVSKSILPRLASADRSWAKKQGVYYKSKHWGGSYKPKAGDLIYFSWSVRDYADHIGIVTGTKKSDGKNYVYTVEGNKHDKCVTASYQLNNKYILGYVSPKYLTKEQAASQAASQDASRTAKEVKYTLKYRDGLAKTNNDEEDSIIPPVKGIFGRNLILSKRKFVRTAYGYSKWQVYRENRQGQLIYLCRDKATGKREQWKTLTSIPVGFKKVEIKAGSPLLIRNEVSGTIYVSPVWKKKKYTVTYKANGGKKAPAAQKKVHGKKLVLSQKKPVRTGYKFRGWATSAKSSKRAYKPGGVYKKNRKITLYAIWSPLKGTFKVKVTKKGGLNVRSGPGLDYRIVRVANEGKKLKINKVRNGWGRIKGSGNWVMLKYTKKVK